MSSSPEIIKFDKNTELEIRKLRNLLGRRIRKYTNNFYINGEKSDFDLIKYIELIAKLYNKLWYGDFKDMNEKLMRQRKHFIANLMHTKMRLLLFYYNNMNADVAKSILDIIIINNYDYNDNILFELFSKYFADIYILKNAIIFMNGIENIRNYVINYIMHNIIDNTLHKINKYSKNIINEKISQEINEDMYKLKQIIYNLNILNYSSYICKIVDSLYKEQRYWNRDESKMKELHNYIFYELNLSNTIEYNEKFTEIMNKYK